MDSYTCYRTRMEKCSVDTDGPIVTLIAADVDGDGIEEIVAASEDRLVYALKP
jgi:hypothetical protein